MKTAVRWRRDPAIATKKYLSLFLIAAAGILPQAGLRAAPDTEPLAARVRESRAPLAPKSRLPYSTGADIWVDAQGSLGDKTAPMKMEPASGGSIRGVRVVVFQPGRNELQLGELVGMHAANRLVSAGAKPELSIPLLPDADANAWETHVYQSSEPDERLVLGFVRNLRSRNLLAFSVLITGKLTDREAATQARIIVDELAGEAKKIREAREAAGKILAGPGVAPGVLTPPVPAGALATRPTVRLTGPGLRTLLQSVESSIHVTPRVREMARLVIPQASAVTVHTWRTSAALPDAALTQFYLKAGSALGWTPVTIDTTRSGRPTLLFQRPKEAGVVMVRGATGPVPSAPTAAAVTTITVLVMDGKINVAELLKR